MDEHLFDELELDPKELEEARKIAEKDMKEDGRNKQVLQRTRKIIESPSQNRGTI